MSSLSPPSLPLSSSSSSNRVRKASDNLPTKMGPMKATLPVSSLLRGPISIGGTIGSGVFTALSPPMRHISPEHNICGHRSPGALNYKCKPKMNETCMRRTASLDALYLRPSWCIGPSLTILQLDKSTQTDESCLERIKGGNNSDSPNIEQPVDIKIEKVIRQRLQRVQRGEHSVSSQTLSPIHAKASPVLIPSRSCVVPHTRPMRNSVEGLNQEIEKLVLHPGQPHTCRPESNLFSRGTPEGHRAPLADLLHGDTRTVNTQTPNRDLLSSDESQSTSPEDGMTSITGASPRINRFLAREPPDGCEKVSLKLTEADLSSTTLFKPCVGFLLKPSLGSAFQPIATTTAETIVAPESSTTTTTSAAPSTATDCNN